MRERQPVDLLEDQIRGLAPQSGSRAEQMDLDFVVRVLDFPSLVLQAAALAGRESAGVEKRRLEPVLHHPAPAGAAARSAVQS